MQAISTRIDADQIGLLGMSFGGGAVTELCKSDARCRAGLNMDGGTFGQRQRQPLQVPYLALTRENQDSLDYLLSASRSDYYAVEVKGTTHLDFTDDAVVLPILKWLNISGDIAGGRSSRSRMRCRCVSSTPIYAVGPSLVSTMDFQS